MTIRSGSGLGSELTNTEFTKRPEFFLVRRGFRMGPSSAGKSVGVP